jgi:hypothetical protein
MLNRKPMEAVRRKPSGTVSLALRNFFSTTQPERSRPAAQTSAAKIVITSSLSSIK